ncbi:hypothetical protein GC194_14050 [bacterium]|nr:hypothetical protein [bacterium]
MHKHLILLMSVAIGFSACDQQKSSVSSTQQAKLLDNTVVDEIQQKREEGNAEVNQFESRMPELMMVYNEEILKNQPDLQAKYANMMNAELRLFQAKMQYDMEKSMFIDKVLHQVATANSKEEVRNNAEALINELRQQSTMYIESCRNLINEMKNAGIDNPLLDDMLRAPETKDEEPK